MGEKNDFSILLNARVPLVPLIILPIPALPTGGPGQGLDQFDHHHILSLLIAELLFKAEPKRRAMGDVQRGAIQLVGQDRLRVIAVGQGMLS